MDTTLLDVLDAAAALNMSARQIRTLVRAGQLPHVVFPNGEVRFDQADLAAWIEAHKRPANGQGGDR